MFSPSGSTSSNPFGQQSVQQPVQQQQASNPFMMQQQTHTPTAQMSNPWQSQQPNSQQTYTQHPQSYQQSTFQQQPFQQQSYQQSAFQQQQTGLQQQQVPGAQQSSNPFDKNSILALYNYPQLAPQRSEQQQTPAAPAPAPAAPMSGQMNPFATSQGPQQGQPLSAAQTPGVRHVSNESVDFAGLMGGRHSPDAFSGLSASFRR
jgi:hypothetical protein